MRTNALFKIFHAGFLAGVEFQKDESPKTPESLREFFGDAWIDASKEKAAEKIAEEQGVTEPKRPPESWPWSRAREILQDKSTPWSIRPDGVLMTRLDNNNVCSIWHSSLCQRFVVRVTSLPTQATYTVVRGMLCYVPFARGTIDYDRGPISATRPNYFERQSGQVDSKEVYLKKGQPRLYQAGNSFTVPPNTPHQINGDDYTVALGSAGYGHRTYYSRITSGVPSSWIYQPADVSTVDHITSSALNNWD